MDSTWRRGLTGVTGGVAVLPLLVLFTLNFVDEFDRIAFDALAPEIRDAFGLSDGGLSTLRAVPAVLALLVALPVGVLADRSDRVRISIGAALLWGAAAVLTGVVPLLALLYAVRFASGLGRITNEVVHPSLLTDYYPRRAHPRVFSVHRMANALGPVAGPIAGIVAAAFFWQAAFFLLAIPTGVALVLARRLREPPRGEPSDAAVIAAREGPPIAFLEARRLLFGVPTLRRLWIGAFFFGLGTLQLGTLISLYFDRVFDYGSVGRGFVQFLLGAGTVAGIVVGGRAAAALTDGGRAHRLPLVVGGAFAPFAVGMLTLAAAPVSGLALVGAFLVAAGNGAYQPAYFSIVGIVAPARIRSQAYAWAVVIYATGGLAYLLVFGAFGGEDGSYRGLTLALAAITTVAGLIGMSSSRFMRTDAARADQALGEDQEI
ncbi:hypothetical protein BH20ACT2_BH20ACT2_11450 [soil metagenome]